MAATLTTTSAPSTSAAILDQLRARLLVVRIGDQRAVAGAALDDDLAVPGADQLPDHLGHERHAMFTVGRLLRDSDLHPRREAIGFLRIGFNYRRAPRG